MKNQDAAFIIEFKQQTFVHNLTTHFIENYNYVRRLHILIIRRIYIFNRQLLNQNFVIPNIGTFLNLIQGAWQNNNIHKYGISKLTF